MRASVLAPLGRMPHPHLGAMETAYRKGFSDRYTKEKGHTVRNVNKGVVTSSEIQVSNY
jgi:hypothetical protein